MHYIDEGENVLVSLDSNVPKGYYEIPHLSSFWLAQAIINNSLYVASKCHDMAFKELGHRDTAAMLYKEWLELNGYKYIDYHCNLKTDRYSEYDALTLACRYGGNYRGFVLLKPFIIPRQYVLAEYDGKRIDEFIRKIKTEGFIEILNNL